MEEPICGFSVWNPDTLCHAVHLQLFASGNVPVYTGRYPGSDQVCSHPQVQAPLWEGLGRDQEQIWSERAWNFLITSSALFSQETIYISLVRRLAQAAFNLESLGTRLAIQMHKQYMCFLLYMIVGALLQTLWFGRICGVCTPSSRESHLPIQRAWQHNICAQNPRHPSAAGHPGSSTRQGTCLEQNKNKKNTHRRQASIVQFT